MGQSTTDVLHTCLDMLDRGKAIEDCMLAYPDQAGILDLPLRAAQAIRSGRAAVDASIPAPSSRRDLILRAAAAQASVPRQAQNPSRNGATADGASGLFSGFRRLAAVPYALPALAAMLILGGAALGVSAATGRPADPAGWLAGSDSDDRIEVRGTISAISLESITVASSDGDVTASITPNTEFEGADNGPATLSDFSVGDFVKLSVLPAADGSLVAREIEHEDAAGDDRDDIDDRAGPTERHDDDRDDNRGPGNAADTDDNSGPGNATDTDDDDNSGPGNADDDDDRSGPGDGDDADDDDSGPGGGNGADDDRSGPDDSDETGDDDRSGSGGEDAREGGRSEPGNGNADHGEGSGHGGGEG